MDADRSPTGGLCRPPFLNHDDDDDDVRSPDFVASLLDTYSYRCVPGCSVLAVRGKPLCQLKYEQSCRLGAEPHSLWRVHSR